MVKFDGMMMGPMVMRNFRQLLQFLAIPVAMTGFVLLASQAGGFVLRKQQANKVASQAKGDSQLISPNRNPRG